MPGRAGMKMLARPGPARHHGGPRQSGLRAMDTNQGCKTTEPDSRLYVASVEKAMMVLEAFEAGRKALTISEIAEHTGLGRSAAQRFVYTLHHLGYLRRDDKRYTVSHRIIDLARSLIGIDTRSERVGPILDEISRHCRETVAWVELDGAEIVIMKSVPSVHLSSVNLPVGQRFAALSASSGQVLLAYATPERVLWAYHNATGNARERFGRRSDQQVLDYFSAVKNAGFVVTEKMEDQDSVSLSVPVLDPAGLAVGALNISMLKSRYSKQDARDQLSDYLVEIGQRATQTLFS